MPSIRGFYIASLIVTACTLSYCSKPELEADYELIPLPITEKVRCLEVVGDLLLIGGGNSESKGFLVQSDLELTQFNVLTKQLKHAVYDLTQFRGRWYVGLDSVEMIVSDDLASFRTYYWRQEDWVSDLSKHPIRRFAQTNDGLYAVAGGKLSFGVIYQTKDENEWNPLEYDNELRAICSFDKSVWVAGNGRLMRLREGQEWERINLPGQFIADLVFTSHNNGVAVTFDGSVLMSSDRGDSWKEVKKKSDGFLNRIIVSGTQVIAIGNAGLIGVSNNSGNSWKWFSMKEELDLLDAVVMNDQCIIGAEDGILIRINLASLR